MFTSAYASSEPDRAQVDAFEGATVIEFGAPWCGHCIAAQPLLQAGFANHPDVGHLKIEDGPRRPLGRSFRVKLWPTLVFLRDGLECARLVRPDRPEAIEEAFGRIDPAAGDPGPAPRA